MDDPFDLLQIEPGFEIDEAALQSRFLAQSAQCHPDRFADPLEQADAADRMSRVTQAYRVLRDPESRARALLALRGGSAEPGTDAGQALPPDLLMEVMEVREAMEEAIASQDSAALAKLRAWAQGEQSQRLENIAMLFGQPASDKNTAAIRLELNALRYMVRMLEQMPEEGVA
ncbi:MAG: Fe-S protein assembly co-chaperone HscB [Phycisphaerales bacterium JB063]